MMQLKLSRVSAAAGLALVATAALANPTGPFNPPGNYTSGTTDIYLAGSSAVDLALTKFIANSCLPGSLDTYRTDAGGKTYWLWTCTTNNVAPNWVLASGNTKIAIHKNTNSSADGTNGVANGAAAFAYLQVSDLNTALTQCAVSPTVVAATSTIPAYNVFNCGTTAGTAGVGTLSQTARFGFSDSEPKQFNVAAAAQLTSAYPLSILFGIPVTKNVRDALQTSQGLAAGDESEAGMPNLTSAQIHSIFTGVFTSWTNLGITVGADNGIYMLRRSNGSGSSRIFDATFIGDYCTPGLTAISAGTALVTGTIPTQCNAVASGGTQILQAGTSEDLAACLGSFQTNAVGAIGYLSTDFQPGLADGYRWVKFDGYSPKLLNVVDGKWKDWSELSLNYNKATPLAGDDTSFYNQIKNTSLNGTLMSEIAQNLAQTTSGLWTGGVMGALPNRINAAGWGLPAGASLTLPRTDATVLAYPANPATRAYSTGYNLCAAPLPSAGYVAH